MTALSLIVYLIAVVAVVMMWRGIWGLMDEYLIPKNPKLSYWVSFILGFIVIAIALAIIQL